MFQFSYQLLLVFCYFIDDILHSNTLLYETVKWGSTQFGANLLFLIFTFSDIVDNSCTNVIRQEVGNICRS